MKITVDLSLDTEAQLRGRIARGDAEAVRALLVEALTPTVLALLREAPSSFSDDTFETMADQLADELFVSFGLNVSPLSDYAVSRAGIYEDHP
ncbi:hypothetical protein [Candidatus Cyanaurora vandensis]|uniref:hypothetical protein n=1 Tax=Candidatus Cyanaurora vandensis TaxID=2714958 RepID=UPI00257F7ED0|nr:hypothetical protein [Candidatus Cyanaurora vandensis]